MKRNCMKTTSRIPDRVIDIMCYDYANKLALAKRQMRRIATENKRRDDAFEKAYRNYLRR